MQDELAAAGVEVGHANWLMLRALAGDKTVGQAKPFRVQHPSRPGEPVPKPKRVSMTELLQQAPAAPKAAARKPATARKKTTAARKPAAKKPAPRKPAAKKAPARKPAAKEEVKP